MKTIIKKFITAGIIICISIAIVGFCYTVARAETESNTIATTTIYSTKMTASVRYNNCNVTHAVCPASLTSSLNAFGSYNFIAQVGSSTLFAIYSDAQTMNFYLDDAFWQVINGKEVMGECVL